MTSLGGQAILNCSFFFTGLSSALVLLCATMFLASSAGGGTGRRSAAKSKLAIVAAASAVVLVLCLVVFLIAARSTRSSGKTPLLSWAGLRHLFGAAVGGEEQDKLRLAEFTALEPIDAHAHISQTAIPRRRVARPARSSSACSSVCTCMCSTFWSSTITIRIAQRSSRNVRMPSTSSRRVWDMRRCVRRLTHFS